MPTLSRRALLTYSASALVASAAPARKLKIIVTGGHPGDPEYGCGGTVARYTSAGHSVALLYLNRGERGCPGKSLPDCGSLRTSEARRACDLLQASPLFYNLTDGDAILDAAHYDSFHQLLASQHPDVVFTHWPIDNHRDHRAMSLLVYDLWLRMNKTFGLYYYEVSNGEDTQMFTPTEYVDITSTEPRKRSACYAHASQTPDRYYALQSQVARFRGLECGCSQAEAFLRHTQSPANLLP
jgi:N-acetylglucosamine malate deacetylase 1